MSKSANPTLIGAFVVGAVAITVAAVLALSGGRLLFRDIEQHVMYFQGSVKGLTVGSPVRFRGVNIGTVTDILLVIGEEVRVRIPVIVEIDNTRFIVGPEAELAEDEDDMDELIQMGLRGQLQLQSLLTGQLFIQLDYVPGSPVNLVKDPMFAKKYAEIPTIPTPIEKITTKLQDFPFDEVLDNIRAAMAGIDNLVNSEDLHQSLTSLRAALDRIHGLADKLDKQVEPLASSTSVALEKFGTTMDEARRTLQTAGSALQKAQGTLDQAQSTLQSAEGLITDDQLLAAIDQALLEIAAAASSIRVLAESIDQRPESLLRGRR